MGVRKYEGEVKRTERKLDLKYTICTLKTSVKLGECKDLNKRLEQDDVFKCINKGKESPIRPGVWAQLRQYPLASTKVSWGFQMFHSITKKINTLLSIFTTSDLQRLNYHVIYYSFNFLFFPYALWGPRIRLLFVKLNSPFATKWMIFSPKWSVRSWFDGC